MINLENMTIADLKSLKKRIQDILTDDFRAHLRDHCIRKLKIFIDIVDGIPIKELTSKYNRDNSSIHSDFKYILLRLFLPNEGALKKLFGSKSYYGAYNMPISFWLRHKTILKKRAEELLNEMEEKSQLYK